VKINKFFGAFFMLSLTAVDAVAQPMGSQAAAAAAAVAEQRADVAEQRDALKAQVVAAKAPALAAAAARQQLEALAALRLEI
jgi:hypothetical protein